MKLHVVAISLIVHLLLAWMVLVALGWLQGSSHQVKRQEPQAFCFNYADHSLSGLCKTALWKQWSA